MIGGTFNFGKKKLLGVVLAILSGTGLCQSTGWAQTPVIVNQYTSLSDTRIQVKSRSFSFPLKFDAARNPKTREVCLYVKEGGGEWVLVTCVSPLAKSIPCQVSHDGEFGFILVTRDANGQLDPANISRLAPTMTVIVETRRQTAPELAKVSGATTQAQYVVVNEQPISLVSSGAASLPPPGGTNVAVVPPSSNGLPEPTPAGNSSQTLLSVSQQNVVSSNSPRRTIVNTTRVGIDYNVGRQGPSGLGKVEVWATPDQGRTWQRVGEDREHRSPVVIADLPGEGVYGIRLAATNGSGFGGKVPSAGDIPNTTIEVDMTSPVINSLSINPVAKNGALEIRWEVTDKNLNPEGINLFFSSQRTGPWQPLAFRVKNEGIHHWTLPANVPPQLFFRLEASDLAGNVGRCDTQNAILLDMTEPEVNVTGIQGIGNKEQGTGNRE